MDGNCLLKTTNGTPKTSAHVDDGRGFKERVDTKQPPTIMRWRRVVRTSDWPNPQIPARDGNQWVRHLAGWSGTCDCFRRPHAQDLANRDGAELHCIQAHGVSAKGVAWTMEGRTLGTVGMDGLFGCWRRDVMQMTMEVPFSTQLLSLEFSPDGRKAATLDGQGRAFLLTAAESSTAAEVGKN